MNPVKNFANPVRSIKKQLRKLSTGLRPLLSYASNGANKARNIVPHSLTRSTPLEMKVIIKSCNLNTIFY